MKVTVEDFSERGKTEDFTLSVSSEPLADMRPASSTLNTSFTFRGRRAVEKQPLLRYIAHS